MTQFLAAFSSVLSVLITIIMLMMTTRAILSLLFDEDAIDNKIYNLMYNITEVVIIPIRYILSRFDFFQNTPIDFSFLITFLVLSFINFMI